MKNKRINDRKRKLKEKRSKERAEKIVQRLYRLKEQVQKDKDKINAYKREIEEKQLREQQINSDRMKDGEERMKFLQAFEKVTKSKRNFAKYPFPTIPKIQCPIKVPHW